MASFKMNNGKEGMEMCRHTSTGYECASNFPRNDNKYVKKAKFFVRHVVGGDGKPYTEAGFTGLDETDRRNGLAELKRVLRQGGFTETDADSLPQHVDDLAFCEHATPEIGCVSVRMPAKKCPINVVSEAVGDLIAPASNDFIAEQEEIDDVLYHSLLSTLGPELNKGPGGNDYATKKARELAQEFMYGFSSETPMRPTVC